MLLDGKVLNDFHRMRLAYDLYGFVRLANCFERWQLDELENGFNRIYIKQTGLHPDYSSARLPPLLDGPSHDLDFMKAFASSEILLNSVRAVAGVNCQFFSADILCVYDDSIGTHRDLLYQFDMPKVLVFLSDCQGPSIRRVPANLKLRSLSGSFAVMPGSHVPESFFGSLSSQLTDWPDPVDSIRTNVTSHYASVHAVNPSSSISAVYDYDSRYQGFSFIPFKRGDVVIFSTRALHALLPTYSNHVSKLASFVFIEDFYKSTGKCYDFSKPVKLMSEEEFSYLSLPDSIALNDRLIRGSSFEDSLAAMDQSLSSAVLRSFSKDLLLESILKPFTRLHELRMRHSDEFLKGTSKNRNKA